MQTMTEETVQLPIAFPDVSIRPGDSFAAINRENNGRANKLDAHDRAFHDWYRFVLSYPPHLVRDYLEDFGLDSRHTVLDPFCGTGTTPVEAKLNGLRAVGLEANPLAHFASSTKLDWEVDPDELERRSQEIATVRCRSCRTRGSKIISRLREVTLTEPCEGWRQRQPV